MENKIERLIKIKKKLEKSKKLAEKLSSSLSDIPEEFIEIFQYEDGEWMGATAHQALLYAQLCEEEVKKLISQIEEYIGGDKK